MYYLDTRHRGKFIGPFKSKVDAETYRDEPIPGFRVSFTGLVDIVSIQDIPPGANCVIPEHGPANYWGNGFGPIEPD
jgi:hypothetical protein